MLFAKAFVCIALTLVVQTAGFGFGVPFMSKDALVKSYNQGFMKQFPHAQQASIKEQFPSYKGKYIFKNLAKVITHVNVFCKVIDLEDIIVKGTDDSACSAHYDYSFNDATISTFGIGETCSMWVRR